jgi:ABC-type Fe3+-hydroxamate transport system substrate-binding protein
LFDNLRQLGWTVGAGGNIQVDCRWPGSDSERIRADVAEIAGLSPDVIIAHSTPVNVALQRLTRTIPVVFVNVTDPISSGLVESLARPGGNITGFSNYSSELASKWIETLKEIDPRIERVASVFNRGGFVESLARPGGNATDFIAYEWSISGKWLELLKEIAWRDPDRLPECYRRHTWCAGLTHIWSR